MVRKLLSFILVSILSIGVAQAKEVTDILGRKVEIKENVKTVVPTFYFEDYFVVTGKEGINKIVGWSRDYWEGRTQATWDAFKKEFPQITDIPDVGYPPRNTLSVEKIIALNPDVVILPAMSKNTEEKTVKYLEKAGIPAVFIDFQKEDPATHLRSIDILGKVFNKEERVAKIKEIYQKSIQRVQNRLAKKKDLKRPKVYMEASGYGITWGKKMWGGIIHFVEGDNIARNIIKGEGGEINPELILKADPEVIIFVGNYIKGDNKNIPLGPNVDKKTVIKRIKLNMQRDGWDDLKAVKNDEIYAIFHDLSRHIFDFVGVEFLAKVIHPELFADVDPQESLQSFFDEFYPIPYNGTWMLKY